MRNQISRAALRAARAISPALRLRLAADGYESDRQVALFFANDRVSWAEKTSGFRYVQAKHFDEIAAQFIQCGIDVTRLCASLPSEEELRDAKALLRSSGYSITARPVRTKVHR